jgi:protein phosphatase
VSLRLRFAAVSDVGRVRRDNQDSGYAGPHLLVIADGVGGAARGDVASSAAVDELKRLDREPGENALGALAGAVHRAHDRLREIVRDHPDLEGTSTTISAGIFDGKELGVVHVGDSRGYLLRDGRLQPLTTDHTLVQSLIEEGRITEEEARVHPHRNLILKAVDGVHEPEPDAHSVPLQAGDRVLFCSDGCSGVLDNDQLAEILGGDDLEAAAVELVRRALEAGSSDNVTVVVAEAVEDDTGAPAEAAAAQVVGAAATQPHLSIQTDRTGSLDPEELAAAGVTGDDLDPEELRYAPRAPRRLLWLRRTLVVVVVLALLAGAGWYLYDLSQKQYYVARAGEKVAIYRGVQADLPGLTLHRVHEETDIELSDLPTSYQTRVRSGISAESLPAARRVVENLRTFAVCGDEAPTPSASPSPRKSRQTGKATRKPSASASPRPRATGTAKPKASATSSPSRTPSPTATSTTPPPDCGDAE